MLLTACDKQLVELGVAPDDIDVVSVPGALEIPLALQALAFERRGLAGHRYDALVALGVVVRGDTYHFEIVANESARGILDVQLETGVPIANGVLTTSTDEQAEAARPVKGRRGGARGHRDGQHAAHHRRLHDNSQETHEANTDRWPLPRPRPAGRRRPGATERAPRGPFRGAATSAAAAYTLHGDTANFEYFGFNDTRLVDLRDRRRRGSSATMRSTVGNCRTFTAGEHRVLGSQDNRHFLGARWFRSAAPDGVTGAAGWTTAPATSWTDAGRGDVQVFDRQNFQGFLANIDRPTPDFDPLGYNDKIASIIVRRGDWEFCTDARLSRQLPRLRAG